MGKTQPNPDDAQLVSDTALRAFVGYNMKRAFNALQAHLVRTLEPFELRMITYSALSLVVENPGLRPSQLAEALSIERANVVVIVDELEERGLITRAPSQSDRRAYTLQCTLMGRQLYDKATYAVQQHDLRMQAHLTTAERAIVRKAMSTIETEAKRA